jgi:hypothetical protein
MNSPPIPTNSLPKKPRSRWFRWLSTLALVALGIGGYALWNWRPPEKLRISPETTAIVEPLTPDGFVDYVEAINQSLHPCAREDNAFVVLFPIIDWQESAETQHLGQKLVEALEINLEEIDGTTLLVSFAQFARQKANEPSPHVDMPQEAMTSLWTAEQFPLVSKWLDQIEPALAVIHQATERTGFYRPCVLGTDGLLISASLHDCQVYRSAADALCARAMLNCAKGDMEGAVADVSAVYQLGRWTGEYRWLITQLVQNALFNRVNRATFALINSGKLTPDQAARLQKQIELPDRTPSVSELVSGTGRYMILQAAIENHFRRRQPIQEIANLLGRGSLDWNLALAEINAYFDEAAEIIAINDPDEYSREHEAFGQKLMKFSKATSADSMRENILRGRRGVSTLVGKVYGAIMFPNTDVVRWLSRRQTADLRLTALALGVFRFHAEHGRLPADLKELSPKYASLPEDELSAYPISYGVEEHAVTLRIAGVNGQPVAEEDPGYFADVEVTFSLADKSK